MIGSRERTNQQRSAEIAAIMKQLMNVQPTAATSNDVRAVYLATVKEVSTVISQLQSLQTTLTDRNLLINTVRNDSCVYLQTVYLVRQLLKKKHNYRKRAHRYSPNSSGRRNV
jgi:hypothetical protein